MRCLISVVGTLGDVLPAVAVGRLLAGRGHDVTIAANAAYREPIEEAGLAALLFGDAGDIARMVEIPAYWEADTGFKIFVREGVMPAIAPLRAATESWARDGKDLAVVAFAYAYGTLAAADCLGIPAARVFIQPTGLDVGQRFGRAVARLDDLASFQAATGGVGPRRSAVRIGLFPRWFAADSELPPDVVTTGFPLYDRAAGAKVPASAERFLGDGPPPVLIAAGSERGVGGTELVVRARAAVRRLGRRSLIVSADPALVAEDDAMVARFLPYSGVLGRVAAMMHHGGIGTIAQCLAAGTPQLALTSNFETPENGAALVAHGCGATLPVRDATGDNIASRLAPLLDSPDLRARCRAVANRLRDDNPFAATAEAIDGLAWGG